jgi:tRNA threonylcarbamoyladenosine biosynthesis protein TsaE
MTVLHLADPEATDVFAALLARTQPEAAVVYLAGDLGAGKSSLARAWLRALGVTGAIRSPTYTLVEHYPYADARLPAGGKALHLDLYRIGDPGELEFLALDDAAATLWLVEWPERGGPALPAADLRLSLAVDGDGRRVELGAGTPVGQAWLARLPETAGYTPFLTPAGRKPAQAMDP